MLMMYLKKKRGHVTASQALAVPNRNPRTKYYLTNAMLTRRPIKQAVNFH